jgi:hypothetical protein
MFRVATRSFAPANVGPRRQAQLLGCHFASRCYQQGLLEIVRKIVRVDHGPCEQCRHGESFPRDDGDPFLAVLEAADRSRMANLRRAMLEPTAFRTFVR